jgi:hypothetical protein
LRDMHVDYRTVLEDITRTCVRARMCHLAQAGVHCPDLVNTIMNFLVPYNSEIILIVLAIILKARTHLTK